MKVNQKWSFPVLNLIAEKIFEDSYHSHISYQEQNWLIELIILIYYQRRILNFLKHNCFFLCDAQEVFKKCSYFKAPFFYKKNM